jgi:uncharacterized metal-binding protein
MMGNKQSPQCSICSIKKADKACMSMGGKGPDFCPTQNNEIIEKALKEYEKPEIKEFARMSTLQGADGFSKKHLKANVRIPTKPRIQEICELAKRMGYRKLGLAFCSGLASEARVVNDILKSQGFDVVSVTCKTGCTDKTEIGIKESEKYKAGAHEPMCSPIAQALFLNEEKTDFNIMVGLCVGHDSLFLKYSEAFATVLVVKDRLLVHNPVAALYAIDSYFARMLRPGIDSIEPTASP